MLADMMWLARVAFNYWILSSILQSDVLLEKIFALRGRRKESKNSWSVGELAITMLMVSELQIECAHL